MRRPLPSKGFTPLHFLHKPSCIVVNAAKSGAGFTQAPLSSKKGGAGFTIPELLVSLFIFSLVMVGAGGLLVSSINAQRRAGAEQELMDQASFLAEYMSRALRQARKELSDPPICLTVAGRGFNYEITQGGQGVKFINGLGQCQEFFLEGQRMKERMAPTEHYLTSDNLQVTKLGFFISGAGQEDNLQPKATFAMELRGKVQQGGFQPTIRMQTTVSQRKVDVPE